MELNGTWSPQYVARIDTDLEEPDLSQAQADLTDRIQQSTCRASHSELVFHGPTLPMPLTFPELACKFDSEHPFFKIFIRQSYIRCLVSFELNSLPAYLASIMIAITYNAVITLAVDVLEIFSMFIVFMI